MIQGELTDQELLLLLDIKSRRDERAASRMETASKPFAHGRGLVQAWSGKGRNLSNCKMFPAQVPWRRRASWIRPSLSAWQLTRAPSKRFVTWNILEWTVAGASASFDGVVRALRVFV